MVQKKFADFHPRPSSCEITGAARLIRQTMNYQRERRIHFGWMRGKELMPRRFNGFVPQPA
jgi:hypothetical protein